MFKISEKILFHQIKNGDEQAFTVFYNHYRNKIYRFVYFKVASKEKAQDLTSEVFIKIFNYLREGQKIENFQAFLYKTARNLVIDSYRTQPDEISLENLVETQEVAGDDDVSKNFDLKFDFEKVSEALKKLPDNYRDVFVLRFIEELSFDEIAETIGEPSGNCRVLAHRGLQQLKNILKK